MSAGRDTEKRRPRRSQSIKFNRIPAPDPDPETSGVGTQECRFSDHNIHDFRDSVNKIEPSLIPD
jgi:hypothetical protein